MKEKGRTYSSERRVYRDRETGLEVVQLTEGQHFNGTCYVSHHGVTGDDRELVFASSRTGFWEFFRVDLQTGSIQQLTANYVPLHGDHLTGQPYKAFEVCAATHRLYYLAGRELRRLDLNNLNEDTLLEIPEGTSPDMPHVNRDGSRLVLGYIERKLPCAWPGQAAAGRLASAREVRYRHPASTIVSVDLANGQVQGVWGETEWLDHVQIHPDQPLALFCREAWPALRAHLVEIDHHPLKEPRLLLPRQKPGIEMTGHELFCLSGEALFVLIERQRPDAPTEKERVASEQGYIAFIGTDGEGFVRYRPPFQVPGHVVARSSQDVIIGNAAFLGAGDPDGHQRLGRFEPDGKGGFDLKCTPLCRHDRTMEHFSGEPHPILDREGRHVFFSSAMGRKG